MRLHKRRRSYGCEINLAPLIDIVFLLIIFFMTVSQISRVQVETVNLPEAESGERSKPLLSGRLVVNVHKDGRISVLGRNRSLAAFRALLAEVVRGRNPDDIAVLVRGDRELPWDTAGAILKACAAQGIYRARVAVVRPGEANP